MIFVIGIWYSMDIENKNEKLLVILFLIKLNVPTDKINKISRIRLETANCPIAYLIGLYYAGPKCR